MHKKLFLTSSFQEVSTLLPQFEENLQGKTITLIPTAILGEDIDLPLDYAKKPLEDLGLVVDMLEISTAPPQEIKSKLSNTDIIYIGGGNTFFLLQELKKSGADKLIIKAVQAGKLFIGESAGSLITAPDIGYASELDDPQAAPNLANYNALNLVDFYVLPHFSNPPFKEAAQKVFENYSQSLNLYPISNHEVILVDGQSIEKKAIN